MKVTLSNHDHLTHGGKKKLLKAFVAHAGYKYPPDGLELRKKLNYFLSSPAQVTLNSMNFYFILN